MRSSTTAVFVGAALVSSVAAQTYKRLGTCPQLGCIFPPSQAEFLPGVYFDIRLEIHAPVNGTEAFANGVPDEKFSFCIQKGKGKCEDVTKYFGVAAAPLEKWTFNYYEDLFAEENKQSTSVNVASKAYRKLFLKEAGEYTARLKYYNGQETTAKWTVHEPAKKRKAKNVILFIGDGMTQPMITAARLIAHKSVNGKYQSLMQMDEMEALGLQMTHSIDSFITDSANSATALNTGHKSTVNALNVYVDSSPNTLDDPKVESIAELFRRRTGGPVGIVSTAVIADATPAAVCSHTRSRSQYTSIVAEYVNGWNSSLSEWGPGCQGPDVVFGGGAEQFIAGATSPGGADYYKHYQSKGYNVVYDKDQLASTDPRTKTLGMFSTGNMAKWLDREVYPDNLKGLNTSPTGDGTAAVNQPGLKEMTLKAVEILFKRSNLGDNKKNDVGFFLMSEAASIDKMMHVLDYDRALAELLELDDTIRATIEYLKKIGEDKDTLIVVTADHGHGFDVFGSADTKYMKAQTEDRKKRQAVGTYALSGLSGYTVAPGSSPKNDTLVVGPQGPGFPVQWDPRFTYAAGFGAMPDHREGYTVKKDGPRTPAVAGAAGEGNVGNPEDQPDGYTVLGTLPVEDGQGVHSLQDVSVFASGPGSEAFRGVYNSVDIFFKIANALALGKESK